MALGTGGLGTLTLYINADTSDFDQAINQVEQKTKNFGSRFNQVERGLELTPNVDDSQLTALNKHLDLKQKHFAQVGRFMQGVPLQPSVKTSNLQELQEELRETVRVQQQISRQLEQSPVRAPSITVAPKVDNRTTNEAPSITNRFNSNVSPKVAVSNRLQGDVQANTAANNRLQGGFRANTAEASRLQKDVQANTAANNRLQGGFQANTVAANGLHKGMRPTTKTVKAGSSLSLEDPGTVVGQKTDRSSSTSSLASEQISTDSTERQARRISELENKIDRLSAKNETTARQPNGSDALLDSTAKAVPVATEKVADGISTGVSQGLSQAIPVFAGKMGDAAASAMATAVARTITPAFEFKFQTNFTDIVRAGKELSNNRGGRGERQSSPSLFDRVIGGIFSGIGQSVGGRISTGIVSGIENKLDLKFRDAAESAVVVLGDGLEEKLGIQFKAVGDFAREKAPGVFSNSPKKSVQTAENLQPETNIENAISYLASQDDGAQTKDKKGFNKLDTKRGQQLAAKVKAGHKLTQDEARAALQMLQKYRKQLAEAQQGSLPEWDKIASQYTNTNTGNEAEELSSRLQELQRELANARTQTSQQVQEQVEGLQQTEAELQSILAKKQQDLVDAMMSSRTITLSVLKPIGRELGIPNIDTARKDGGYSKEQLVKEVVGRSSDPDKLRKQLPFIPLPVAPDVVQEAKARASMSPEQLKRSLGGKRNAIASAIARTSGSRSGNELSDINNVIEKERQVIVNLLSRDLNNTAKRYLKKQQKQLDRLSGQLAEETLASGSRTPVPTIAPRMQSNDIPDPWIDVDQMRSQASATKSAFEIIGDVIGAFTEGVGGFTDRLSGSFRKIVDSLEASLFDVGEFAGGVTSAFKNAFDSFGNLFEKKSANAQPASRSASGDINSINQLRSQATSAKNIFENLGDVIEGFAKRLRSDAKKISEAFKTMLVELISSVVNFGKGVFGGKQSAASGSQAEDPVQKAYQAAQQLLQNQVEQAQGIVKSYTSKEEKQQNLQAVADAIKEKNRDAERNAAIGGEHGYETFLSAGFSGMGGYNPEVYEKLTKTFGEEHSVTPVFNTDYDTDASVFDDLPKFLSSAARNIATAGGEGVNPVAKQMADQAYQAWLRDPSKKIRFAGYSAGAHAASDALEIFKKLAPAADAKAIGIGGAPFDYQRSSLSPDEYHNVLREDDQLLRQFAGAFGMTGEYERLVKPTQDMGLAGAFDAHLIDGYTGDEATAQALRDFMKSSNAGSSKQKNAQAATAPWDQLRTGGNILVDLLDALGQAIKDLLNNISGFFANNQKQSSGTSAPQAEAKTNQQSEYSAIFTKIAQQAASRSGIKIKEGQMPRFRFDDNHLKSIGARAQYNSKNNTLILSSEVKKAFQALSARQGNVGNHKQALQDVLHELRHAFQYNFGALNQGALMQGAKPGVMTPFASTSSTAQRYGNIEANSSYYAEHAKQLENPKAFLDIIRDTEADAEDFAEQWKEIIEGAFDVDEQALAEEARAPIQELWESMTSVFSSSPASPPSQKRSRTDISVAQRRSVTGAVAGDPKLRQNLDASLGAFNETFDILERFMVSVGGSASRSIGSITQTFTDLQSSLEADAANLTQEGAGTTLDALDSLEHQLDEEIANIEKFIEYTRTQTGGRANAVLNPLQLNFRNQVAGLKQNIGLQRKDLAVQAGYVQPQVNNPTQLTKWQQILKNIREEIKEINDGDPVEIRFARNAAAEVGVDLSAQNLGMLSGVSQGGAEQVGKIPQLIEAAQKSNWKDIFENLLDEIDDFTDVALDRFADFVEGIPGGNVFAKVIRGAKEFKSVILGFVGLQVAWNGLVGTKKWLDSFDDTFVEAAISWEKFETLLRFSSKTFNQTQANIKLVRDEAIRLRTDLKQSMKGFSQIASASIDTGLEGEGTKQIFKGVNQAGAAYGLDNEQQGRVYTAVSQMISKNSVSSEELKQQLGEVLPGSFQIAARAAGKTTQEFSKLLETGQVLAEDFLPKFAQQLSAETAVGVAGAAATAQGATNKFSNSLLELQVSIGKFGMGERNLVLNVMANLLDFAAKNAVVLSYAMGSVLAGAVIACGQAFAILLKRLVASGASFLATKLGVTSLGLSFKQLGQMIKASIQSFLVITVLLDTWEMFRAAMKDSSGKSREFADTTTGAFKEVQRSIAEARGELDAFYATQGKKNPNDPNQKKRGQDSLIDEAPLLGWMLPKEIEKDDNILNKARFSVRQTLAGAIDGMGTLFNPGAALKSVQTGDRTLMPTYANKKFQDQKRSTQEILGNSSKTVAATETALGDKELAEVKAYDEKLRQIQIKRRGVVQIDPGNKKALADLRREEDEVLVGREKAYKPLVATQASNQQVIQALESEVEVYKEKIAQAEADLPAATNSKDRKDIQARLDYYKTTLPQLQDALKKTQDTQDAFTKSIGETVNKFALLQKQLQNVVDRLADANDGIQMIANESKSELSLAAANGDITQGQAEKGRQVIDQDVLEEQLKRKRGAINEFQGLLFGSDAQAILESRGIKDIKDVGQAQLGTLASKAKDGTPEKEVFTKLQEMKKLELEASDMQAQLNASKEQAAQQIRDANKQIGDYFRDVSRQAADLALSSKEAGMQIAMQSEKNRLKNKLGSFQDTFFSSFVDYLIEGVDTLNEPLQASLEREREVQQAEFARQDRDRQAVDIAKSLPLDTQAIKLDFSAIDSAPVKELQKSLQESAIAGENVTKAAKGAGAAIGDSAEQADVLGGSFGEAIDQVAGIESATGSVGDALQDNISQAQGVNAELMNNRNATDENRVAVEGVNDAVGTQQSKIFDTTAATEEAKFATLAVQTAWSLVTGGVGDTILKTYELFKGLVANVPFLNQFSGIFASWEGFVQKLIAKTWEFFKGLAANLPFLNQIGQTISGWGQSVANVAGGLVGEAGHQLDRLTNWAGGGGKVTERYRTGTLAAQEYAASRDGGSRRHAGQDIDVSGNQEAQSFIGGVVTRVVHDRDGAGYGSYVDVYNKALGVVERIAEVLEVNVKEGQEIKAGQAIGRGESHTGVFHYEIRKPVDAQGRGGYGFEGTEDPIKFYEKLGIAKREGNDIKILKGMNAGQSLKASEHGVGDGHNHFGEDDLKKANQGMAGVMGSSAQKMLASMGGGLQMPSMSFGGGAGTAGKGNSGTATTPDQFVGAVLSILEAPTRQGRVDVAQVISNRVGTNFGGYGGNVRDQAFASGQFQPFFRETYGIGKGDIKDQSSAIAALRKAGYSAQQAQEALSNFFADIKDPTKVADTQSKVGGRAYFKGVSEQPHMRSDDFLRNKNENFFHHEDGDTKNRKLTTINAVFSGAAGGSFSGNFNTASAAPAQQMPAIAPVPFASMPGGESYSSTEVNTSRLTAAQAASAAMERKQRADAIEKERERNKVTADEGKRRQERALEERRRALLELDTNRVQLNRQFEDANLDNRVQTPQVEAQRGITNTKRTYEDLRKEISEKLVQAKRGKDQAAGVLSELTSPNYQARPGQDVAKDIEATQRAIAAADKYIADLEANNAQIAKLESDAIKFKEAMAAREKKVQEDQEKLATENVSISVLEAEADRLKGMRDRGVRDQGVENLPKLEAEIAARREEAQLKGQLADLDEKIFKNQDNQTVVAELNKQKTGLTERLGIVKKTIEANRAYSEEVMRRENNKINREANNAQAQQELEVLKQQLAGLQELSRLNPTAPGTEKIAELEEVIALKELELKLSNDLAAVEEARFKNEINSQQYEARVKSIKEENALAKDNIALKRKQADIEARIARARVGLQNREQDSEVKGSVTEALAKNIEFGRSKGDPLSMRFEQQRSQQKISFDKQMLDLDELEASGKRTKEAVDALRQSYIQLNEVSLDNLAEEQKRATEDRNLAISGKMVGSSNALLDEEAARYDRFGFGKTGDKFRERSAIASQGQAFAEAQVELERFIGSQNVSVEKAAQLRGELAQLNQVKLDGIQESFSPLKDVISGTAGSFKGLFSDLLSGTKTVGEAFKGFLDSILSNLANLAAEFITNELFSGLLPGRSKGGGGGGGGGIMGLLGGLMGGGGSGGGMGGGLGFLSAVPNLLGIFHNGGTVGDAAHIQAYASGGSVSGCGCRACAMARGGMAGSGIEESLEAAMKREKSMNGGRPARVIVATEGEFVVPVKVASRLTKGEKNYLLGQSAPNRSTPSYSQGGFVGNMGSTNISERVTNMNGSTKIEGSTVNVNGEGGGSMSAQEARAMQAAIDQRVTEVVSKMTRPRGLLYR